MMVCQFAYGLRFSHGLEIFWRCDDAQARFFKFAHGQAAVAELAEANSDIEPFREEIYIALVMLTSALDRPFGIVHQRKNRACLIEIVAACIGQAQTPGGPREELSSQAPFQPSNGAADRQWRGREYDKRLPSSIPFRSQW